MEETVKEDIVPDLENYIHEVLGVTVNLRPLPGIERLPFFLRDSYAFYRIDLLQKSYVVIALRDDTEPTPAIIRNHMDQVQNILAEQCIYVQATISPHNRKRLIGQRAPFIVPGTQMYLPDLGLDLREHFRRKPQVVKELSPATQAVIIHALMNRHSGRIRPAELARAFKYSAMTMTRVLNEIESTGLADVHRVGRQRWLHFNEDRRRLWEKARPLMRDPVKKRLWIHGEDISQEECAVEAGLTALSRRSLLNPPDHDIYAVAMDTWKKLESMGIEKRSDPEQGWRELEIWHYDPCLLQENRAADPFSTYLSLQGKNDERVDSALQNLMREIQW